MRIIATDAEYQLHGQRIDINWVAGLYLDQFMKPRWRKVSLFENIRRNGLDRSIGVGHDTIGGHIKFNISGIEAEIEILATYVIVGVHCTLALLITPPRQVT